MGNVVLAHKKFPGESIETQILVQVGIDVLAQTGEQGILLGLGMGRLFSHIDDSVDAQHQ